MNYFFFFFVVLQELLLRAEEQSRNVQDCLRDVQIMESCEENAKGLKVEATSLLQVLSSISDNLQIRYMQLIKCHTKL